MNQEIIKIYLIEVAKLFLIFLFIRTLLDFGLNQNAFNLQQSLTQHLVAAGIFALVLGVIRVIKIQRKKQGES